MEKTMTSLRKWATPLTVASFLIMGVTGTLMFFHLETTLGKVVHEWASWAMLVGVGAHLVLNWRPFASYLKRPLAAGIMAVGAGLVALTFLPIGPEGGNPTMAVMRAMGQADVETVIALSGQELDAGLAALKAAGFEATGDQPLQVLTGGDRGAQFEVINALFTR